MSSQIDQTNPFPPYTKDIVCGVMQDERGVGYIMFTRTRKGYRTTVRTMAQTPDRTVLAVANVVTKGIIFRKFVITLTNVSKRSFQIVTKDIRESSQDSSVKYLVMATNLNTVMGGSQYTPEDFWTPLSDDKIAEAIEIAKNNPT